MEEPGKLNTIISGNIWIKYILYHPHFTDEKDWLGSERAILVAHQQRICCNAGASGNLGSIPGSGRSPGEGRIGNPLQYSCLKNPMDREAWQATVHRVTRNQTRLKQPGTHTHVTLITSV